MRACGHTHTIKPRWPDRWRHYPQSAEGKAGNPQKDKEPEWQAGVYLGRLEDGPPLLSRELGVVLPEDAVDPVEQLVIAVVPVRGSPVARGASSLGGLGGSPLLLVLQLLLRLSCLLLAEVELAKVVLAALRPAADPSTVSSWLGIGQVVRTPAAAAGDGIDRRQWAGES